MNKPPSTVESMRTSSRPSKLPWAVGTLITIVVLTLIVMIFGSVIGEEFNPWTFRRQRYRFMQIPILRWQVVPTSYDDITNSAEMAIGTIIGAPPIPAYTVDGEDEDVADDELDKADETDSAKGELEDTPSRWDLVESRRATAQPWFGDAKILRDSLNIRDHRYNAFWEVWTTKNPKAADVLWPIVARAAQANLYLLIPDLLDIASNQSDLTDAKDVDRLAADLERVVGNEGLKLASALLADKKPERARLAYELVLEYQPDSTTAQAGFATATAAVEAEAASKSNAPANGAKTKSGKTATPIVTPPAEVNTEFPDGGE